MSQTIEDQARRFLRNFTPERKLAAETMARETEFRRRWRSAVLEAPVDVFARAGRQGARWENRHRLFRP